jgi:plasmid stabilization system protein ParE
MVFALEFRPDAEQDLIDARDWYESKCEGLGTSFVDGVDAVIAQLRERPEMYAVVHRGARLARVTGFSYVIAYRFANEEIKIISVFHGHRDPNVWQSRLD